MSPPAGFNLPLSLPRRFMGDLLHFAQKVPSAPVERRMNLAAVVAARTVAMPRPSWCGIFTKAYAFVCAAWPELRRAYLAFPQPHLYQHPVNKAAVAVERRFGDEDAVLFGHIREPEKCSLPEIDFRLRQLKEQPIETITSFRRGLWLSRLPRPLRRGWWWLGLNVSGRKRAHYLGTFGVNAVAGLGAAALHPLAVVSTTLSYGVIGSDGAVDVRILYDHRVVDGPTIARALADLERVLHHEILAELRYLQALDAG
jgi:hypothetical protein